MYNVDSSNIIYTQVENMLKSGWIYLGDELEFADVRLIKALQKYRLGLQFGKDVFYSHYAVFMMLKSSPWNDDLKTIIW